MIHAELTDDEKLKRASAALRDLAMAYPNADAVIYLHTAHELDWHRLILAHDAAETVRRGA